jgi:PAS domain S-box-containing protein
VSTQGGLQAPLLPLEVEGRESERIVARATMRILGSDERSLDQNVSAVLRELLPFTGADRAFLFRTDMARRQGRTTHEACREGHEARSRLGASIDMSGQRWVRQRFTEQGTVQLDQLSDLPAEATLERTNLEDRGVQALLLVPAGASDGTVGSLGVECYGAPRAWRTEDRQVLQVLANLISTALDRRRSMEALRAAEARQRMILDALPDMVFVVSVEGRILDVHTPHDMALPMSPAQLVGGELAKLMPERVAALVMARVRETIATSRPQMVQYMLPIQQERRYFEVRFAPRTPADVLAVVRDITERKQAEQQLREQEKLYEILVQSTLDAIVLSDKEGRILSWNPGAERMFGYRDKEIIGQPLERLVPEYVSGRASEVDSFMRSGVSGMLNRVVELWGLRKSGERFTVEITLSAWSSSGQTLLASVIRDITERKSADQKLRESEHRYRQLVQNSADGILLHDETGRLMDVNDRTVEMLGYSREELLCMSMLEVERDQLPEVHRQIWARMKPEQAMTLEGSFQRKDGSQYPVEMRMAKFRGWNGVPLILSIARDITERKASEAVMLEHQAQLRALASQLTLTEEQQRRELAVELHDGIGQELAMARLRLQTYQSAPDGAKNPQHLDHALRYVQQAIGRVHSLTFDLSPPTLHELGLPAALRSLGRRFQEDHGIRFEYEQSGEEVTLPKELEVLLYRTVRELTMNVVKHAKANTLRVGLMTSRTQVEITVEDDGIGLDPARVRTRTSITHGGFGLFSVRERLSSVQGTLDLQSGGGTVATIVVPLDEHTPYSYVQGGSSP